MFKETKFLVTAALCFIVCNPVFAKGTDEPKMSVGKDKLVISCGRSDMVYAYRSVPAKPYIRSLTTPGGINILRDAPHDHLHHHGLMFALKIDATDFWSEFANCGYQVHQSFDNVCVSAEGQNSSAIFTDVIDWTSFDTQKVIVKENRNISLTQSDNAAVMTWQTVLKTSEGVEQVKIGGSHYFGLGMRFVESMDTNGTFINATGKEGKIFRGTERLVSSKWCAYQSAVDGKPVTVAMFDHPENFRPVTWFTMLKPFSYLSATLRYHEKPFVLKAKEELNLKYGVVVWDGMQSKEVIEKAYQKWAKPMKSKK
ncbi:MAG: PmoA family protein [Phycisphaerae bacterium]|nr:PmoA family protein [Phycisphaerae bacterium]